MKPYPSKRITGWIKEYADGTRYQVTRYVCGRCKGSGVDPKRSRGSGTFHPECWVCDGTGEVEDWYQLFDTEACVKAYNKSLEPLDYTCPFCGTDCDGDCQHSRPWHGEVRDGITY